jgi:hypothetical protein
MWETDEPPCTEDCHLLKQPTELLSEILCLATEPRSRSKSPESVLDLRSVSRKFRRLVPFWYDELFTFESLYPPYFATRREIASFAKRLFQDSHLSECLVRRKRHWTVPNFEMFGVFDTEGMVKFISNISTSNAVARPGPNTHPPYTCVLIPMRRAPAARMPAASKAAKPPKRQAAGKTTTVRNGTPQSSQTAAPPTILQLYSPPPLPN